MKPQKASPGKERRMEYLTQKSKAGEGSQRRKVRLRFCVSPVEILGENGRVTAVKIEKNELYPDEKGEIRSRGMGQYEVIPVGLIFRSIGYQGVPLPGVPFDEKRGIICNQEGRVTDSVSGQIVPNEYAVGWAKRGPTGLIGTNKSGLSGNGGEKCWRTLKERVQRSTWKRGQKRWTGCWRERSSKW